jgi:glycosyltransferase involved in cell wall biosynthesis
LKEYQKKDNRIKIYRLKKHKGLSFALNFALKKTRGDYIARMDADDISHPKRLEKQINFLIKNNDYKLVGTQVVIINESDKKIGEKKFPLNHQDIYKKMMIMSSIQHATILTKADFIKKFSYQNHTTAEDVTLLFKIILNGKTVNLKEYLYFYRLRKNSNSNKNPKRTFYLTLNSRIKAILKLGYKPTLFGIINNFIQFLTISLLPNDLILLIYKIVRIDLPRKKEKIFYILKKMFSHYFIFFKNKLALSVK